MHAHKRTSSFPSFLLCFPFPSSLFCRCSYFPKKGGWYDIIEKMIIDLQKKKRIWFGQFRINCFCGSFKKRETIQIIRPALPFFFFFPVGLFFSTLWFLALLKYLVILGIGSPLQLSRSFDCPLINEPEQPDLIVKKKAFFALYFHLISVLLPSFMLECMPAAY